MTYLYAGIIALVINLILGPIFKRMLLNSIVSFENEGTGKGADVRTNTYNGGTGPIIHSQYQDGSITYERTIGLDVFLPKAILTIITFVIALFVLKSCGV